MTLKKMCEILDREGVTEIDASEDPLTLPDMRQWRRFRRKIIKRARLIEEVRKGFTLKGQVIRPSLVKVAVKLSDNNSDKKVRTE
jgi:molecular chaperone GrpE